MLVSRKIILNHHGLDIICFTADLALIIDLINLILKKSFLQLTLCYLKVPETKIAACANSVVLDEVAHNEPPHLGLHCLPSSL